MEIISSSSEQMNSKRKYTTSSSYYGAIRNSLVQMQDHARGLGDIFKNTQDEYIRLKFKKEDCLSILFFKNGTKDNTSKIGFLDFGGMDDSAIKNFSEFHSQDASHRNSLSSHDVFGGKGNGGKLYGIGLFDKAMWYSGIEKQLKAVGFESKIVSAKLLSKVKDQNLKTIHDDFGHFTNVTVTLDKYLKLFGIKFKDLPVKVKKLAESRKSFTFFIGENVKMYPKQIKVQQELRNIISNQQSILPMEMMSIYICNNGKFLREDENSEKYKYLKPSTIEPHKDQYNQISIDIPEILEDPDTNNVIDMTGSSFRKLIIKSSQLDMPNSALRGRHLIVGRLASGELKAPQGHWKMRDVSTNPNGFSRHLYGEIYHDELKEYTTNAREEFTSAPFTNALRKFILDEIDKVAEAHQERKKTEIQKKQKENINNFQRNLEKVFKENSFIKHKIPGEGNLGTNGTGKKPVKKKYPGELKNMNLSLAHEHIGKGVVFRPKLISYDSDGNIIKNYPREWHISDNNILAENERQLNLLYSKNYGKVKLHAISKKNRIKSNTVEVEVINISKIIIKDTSLELKERTSKQVNYEVIDTENKSYNSCYLTYATNNQNVLGLTPKGLVSGLSQGETELTAMTDDCFSNSIKVNVLENEKPPKSKGGGFPVVLKSGIDPDPLNEDGVDSYDLDKDHPPIFQRPIDIVKGIWWINFQSPLTNLIWNQAKNKKNILDGEKSSEFRVYFLEQWFEIMARVNILSNPDTRPDTLDLALMAIDDEKVDFNKKIEPFIKDILTSNEFFESNEN